MRPDIKKRISIVTVTHESSGCIEAMLASLGGLCKVCIVDNASIDIDETERIAGKFPYTDVIRQEKNIGYGAACNLGAALLDTELLFFVNPDTRMAENCLEEIIAAADRHLDCVAMNPRILTRNNRLANKRRSILIRGRIAADQFTRDSEVPVLTGSALCVRRSDFLAVGGFDPRVFLYHEDDDLSVRMKRERGCLIYVHSAVVKHERGKSSAQDTKTYRFKAAKMGQSRVYVGRKHNRPFVLSRALLLAGMQLLNPAVLYSARKRAKQTAFLAGIISEWRGADSVGQLHTADRRK